MGLVYSTHHGSMCPACRRPATACACRREVVPAGDGVVRVGRETQGRKGAGVTVVTGVPLPAAELKALAGALKRACGSGGTVKDRVIEVQGDHRDVVVRALEARGFRVKRVGG